MYNNTCTCIIHVLYPLLGYEVKTLPTKAKKQFAISLSHPQYHSLCMAAADQMDMMKWFMNLETASKAEGVVKPEDSIVKENVVKSEHLLQIEVCYVMCVCLCVSVSVSLCLSPCMCECVYVFLRVYVCVCLYVCHSLGLCVCVCLCVCMYLYIHIFVSLCICVYIYMCVCISFISVYILISISGTKC